MRNGLIMMVLMPLLLADFPPTAVEHHSFYSGRTIPFDDHYERVVNKDVSDRLSLHYEVRGNDIYIECHVQDFHFRKQNGRQTKVEGEGHIQLYINDAKIDSIYKPSFIIKSLPSGQYKIKIELVHNDASPYGVNEEFEINL